MTRAATAPQRLGRYVLLDSFASGGMATVHFGRQLGPGGIGRLVAMKRLHRHLVTEAAFVAMFLDEARMAMRVRHPNVVPVLDVLDTRGEIVIVMEYVAGAPLSWFIAEQGRPRPPMPTRIALAIAGEVLLGLHAAHEATNELGEPLGLIHRDVSPENVVVGMDGVSRLIDFGIAKAAGRLHVTRDACLKGKIAYMAPEQLAGRAISRRSDVYSASVVLWECLTGRRLLMGEQAASIEQALLGDLDPPSRWVPDLRADIDDVVMRGLAREPHERWSTAREMTMALDNVIARASAPDVADWVRACAPSQLKVRSLRAQAAEAMRVNPMPSRRFAAAATATATFGVMASIVVARIEAPAHARSEASDTAPRSENVLPAAPALSMSPRTEVSSKDTERLTASTAARLPVSTKPKTARPVSAHSEAPSSAQVVAPTALSRDEERSCRVPYVIDDHGHRRYIRACL